MGARAVVATWVQRFVLITVTLLVSSVGCSVTTATPCSDFPKTTPQFYETLQTTSNNMEQPSRPTDELLEELEKLIAYRMERTGENREQVCSHFVNYIKKQYND